MSDLSIEQKNSLAKIDELFKKFEEVSNASNIDKDDFSELVILGKLNLNDDELRVSLIGPVGWAGRQTVTYRR